MIFQRDKYKSWASIDKLNYQPCRAQNFTSKTTCRPFVMVAVVVHILVSEEVNLTSFRNCTQPVMEKLNRS